MASFPVEIPLVGGPADGQWQLFDGQNPRFMYRSRHRPPDGFQDQLRDSSLMASLYQDHAYEAHRFDILIWPENPHSMHRSPEDFKRVYAFIYQDLYPREAAGLVERAYRRKEHEALADTLSRCDPDLLGVVMDDLYERGYESDGRVLHNLIQKLRYNRANLDPHPR